MDAMRIASSADADQLNRWLGAVLDAYFALTSTSGTWAVEAVQNWHRAAGLSPLRPIWLQTMPGAALLSAVRPN